MRASGHEVTGSRQEKKEQPFWLLGLGNAIDLQELVSGHAYETMGRPELEGEAVQKGEEASRVQTDRWNGSGYLGRWGIEIQKISTNWLLHYRNIDVIGLHIVRVDQLLD